MITHTLLIASLCLGALGKVKLNFYSDGSCQNYKTSATLVKPTDDYSWIYNAGSVLISDCTEVLPNQNKCKVELYWQTQFQGGIDAKTPGGSNCLKLASTNDGLTITRIRYWNVYQG